MRNFLLCLPLVLMLGCATKLADGPYNGDVVLYQADKTITESYEVLHAFVKWEFENRAALAQWPGINQGADYVRQNAESWIGSAVALREAYKANPSGEQQQSLERSLSVLRTALSEATRYMTMNVK